MRRRDSLKFIAMAPIALSTYSVRASAQSWRRAADMPLATQEIYPTSFAGELIVAGGIASKAGAPYFTDRCVAFNPTTNTWREHSKLPEPRHHAALVVANSRLFMIGGFNGSYTRIWRMRDTVHEYIDSQWKEIMHLPHRQAEGVIATSPLDLIHVVTGQQPKGDQNKKRSDHQETHNHWCWDSNESQWSALAPIPTARNSATGGWIGNQMIVAGGRTSLGNLSTVEIYDLKSDTWRDAQPLPLPQAGTASVMIDDGLILFGGEIFTPTAKVFEEVWLYSLSSDSWQTLPPLPVPRHGLGAVRFGNKAYVVGGAEQPSGVGTSDIVEVLDLKSI